MKRAIDLLVSTLGLLLLAPLFALVSLAIKLDSPGPVFFRQERVGRHGRVFRIFKFRTMGQTTTARQITVGLDPRITRVGAVLRRSKLDELAQLIDVWRGTMSLVGPRPEVPQYVARYTDLQRAKVLSVRPGITDFASVKFRNESDLLAQAEDPEREYITVILPQKLRSAVNYVDHASLGNDAKALHLTLKTVFAPRLPLGHVRQAMQRLALWQRIDRLMSHAHPWRTPLATLMDGLLVLALWHFTYLFRLGFERWQPGRPWYDDWVSLGVVLTYLLAMSFSGVRRSLWRFFGFHEFSRLALACLVAGSISALVVLLAQLVAVPRAVLLLHPVFCLAGLSVVRMLHRLTWEHAQAAATGAHDDRRIAIVMGSGLTARQVLSGLHRRQGWHVLMLLDDDPAMQGMRIAGVPVLGGLQRVCDPGLTLGATHVVLALGEAAPDVFNRALALARQSGLVVMTVPAAADLQADKPD